MHPQGTGTGLALPSRALVPHPPSPGRMQRGWLLVSFPNLSFLCFRSFGTYLVPPPRDPTGGFDLPDTPPPSPLEKRGEPTRAKIQPPREHRAGCRQGQHIQHRAHPRLPRGAAFLERQVASGMTQVRLSLPTQTHAGPGRIPTLRRCFLGPPLRHREQERGRQLQGAAPAPQPRFRKTPEVFSYSQKHLLG